MNMTASPPFLFLRSHYCVQWDLPKCKLMGPGFWRALREGVHLGNIENIQSCYDVEVANNIAHVNLIPTVTILIFIITISHKSTSVRLLPTI